MNSLPPIPIPRHILWREFRVRILPVLVFAVVLGAVVLLWARVNTACTLNGVGEGVRSLVTSPQAGLLREIKVRPYQQVNQGDPLAVIQPLDSALPLDLLRTELDVARMRYAPSIAEQSAMNYEQVRSDLLRLKSELAIAKVNVERAKNEVARNTPLYKEKLVSEDIWDLSVKTQEAFQAEVTEKSKAVQEMEQRLTELRPLGDPQIPHSNSPMRELLDRINAGQISVASNLGPITLVAPISGMVGAINRQEGEYLVEGEPLLGVQSPWADRVIGFLRQPYPVDPEVGLQVRVTTRTQKRQVFWASITQVGAQVEMITNALAFVRQGALVDVGLPIVIGLPAQNHVRPGELVDLWIKSGSARTESARAP